jgi:hypothetical protein
MALRYSFAACYRTDPQALLSRHPHDRLLAAAREASATSPVRCGLKCGLIYGL